MKTRTLIYGLILLALLLPACGAGSGPTETKSLVFMAGYIPQANLPLVGVYVAQEKGFFAEEQLTVEIQHSAGKEEHLQLLMANRIQITNQDAAVLLKRRANPGLPLVSIGLLGHRGQQAFVALKDSGIETLEDWKGRKIGYKGTPPPDLLALLDAAGLTEADVELINVGFDPRVLTEGMVEVYPVFKSNEPDTLRSWGYELTMWEAADYGVPTLGLTYVTTPDIIQADPERIERFMRAALRGIEYAKDHPDEAIEYVLKYTGPEADAAHQKYMLETELRDAYSPLTEQYGLGWQTAEQWQALADSLLKYNALAQPVDVNEVFDNRFLEQIYGK